MPGPIQRRLAAILAADVAGHSRLMSKDEEGTLAATIPTSDTLAAVPESIESGPMSMKPTAPSYPGRSG